MSSRLEDTNISSTWPKICDQIHSLYEKMAFDNAIAMSK